MKDNADLNSLIIQGHKFLLRNNSNLNQEDKALLRQLLSELESYDKQKGSKLPDLPTVLKLVDILLKFFDIYNS